MKHTLDKQVKTWWDITTLKQYVKDSITPKRIHWDVAPNDGLDSQDIRDEWYNFFNVSEKNLLGLIISIRKTNLRLLEAKIQTLKEQLNPVINRIQRKKCNI